MLKRILSIFLFPALIFAQAPTVSVPTRGALTRALTIAEADSIGTTLQHQVNASARGWGYRETGSSGLIFAVYGGYTWNGTTFVQSADQAVTLTPSATNYVQVSTAGVVSANTTGFSSLQLPLYTVTTSASAVTSIVDARLGGLGASGSRVTGFNGRVGAVVPTSGDYTFAQIGSKPTTLAGYGITDTLTNTFNGRSGAVVPTSGDYTASLVPFTPAGTGATTRTSQDKMRERVSVLDFGAKGDGVTDDTTAISNAITAAGVGGTIEFPNGLKYVCGPITLLNYQTIKGTAYVPGGGSVVSTLNFKNLTGSQVGITTGVYDTFEDILIAGPGSTIGTCTGIACGAPGTPSALSMQRCVIQGWALGLNQNSNYYTKISNSAFRLNALAVSQTGCYNAVFSQVMFNGANSVANTGGNLVLVNDTAHPIYFSGCSFEGWGGTNGYAVKFAGNSSLAVFNGCYFELSAYGVTGTEVGIEFGTGSHNTLSIQGCAIYMYNLIGFINAPNAVAFALYANSNHFYSTTVSSPLTTPYAYILPTSKNSVVVDLSNDDFSDVTKGTYTADTVTATNPAYKGQYIRGPLGAPSPLSDHAFAGRPVANYALTASPATTLNSTVYWANPGFWNPAQDTNPSTYPVMWDGSAWRKLYTRIYYGTAAPSTGTWQTGDQVFNATPSVYNPPGWVCTSGGSPGTWQALPPIHWLAGTTTALTISAPGADYICDTTGGAFTITMPASPTNTDTHTIVNSGTNALTIAGNGHNIGGGASYVIPGQWGSVTLTYSSYSGKWIVVSASNGYLISPVGGSVASAATITPTAATFHVTGTTQINTINLPFTGFTGAIRIIPDGVFTTSTSGNIALTSTAVVGRVMEMTYDGTKWYPSY